MVVVVELHLLHVMSRPESTWCRRVSEATPIRMSIPEGCSVGVNHAAVDVAASGGVGSGRRSYLVVQVGKDGPEFPLCCLPSGFARQCRLSLAFSAADRLVILSVRGDATLSVAGAPLRVHAIPSRPAQPPFRRPHVRVGVFAAQDRAREA